ncbi:hypothetical protein BC835DRAFT_1230192, partial [Cytidiella melzeri]
RELALAEMLRLEGWRGTSREVCPRCTPTRRASPSVRCDDCCSNEVLCESCCVAKHTEHPFHRVKQWKGTFFQRTTLQALGLVMQIGHPSHEICPLPLPAPRSFMVLHTNGFHPMTLQFCQCNLARQAGSRYQQLLRAELFPSTVLDPSTCCTFRLMEHFHLLTLQSKISAYDYYHTLAKLTDNAGLIKPYDRLKPFLRMVRQWRHLKMLKRAGRGHHPDGPKMTRPGELCVVCPACPNPQVNLPDNWETASDDIKYLYTVVVALDANFRLRRRAISNEMRDPALGSGWGYFVEDNRYRGYLQDRTEDDEISTCTGFAALMSANSKFTKGYATSGVIVAIDARHGFVLPNGIGDLQKGERYSNVDYVTGAMWGLLPPDMRRVISYDIVCQWAVNFASRAKMLPEHIRLDVPTGNDLRYAIPKFHFRAHKHDNHDQYSLHFMPGVGRVDGEEIERNWSRHNQVAYSTREMGPGSRHDTLEDHFGFANWQKFIGIGPTLKRRLKDASIEKVAQDRIYDDFRHHLQAENVRTWTDAVLAWEKDPTLPSPYCIPSSGITEAEVKARLLEEDAEAAEEDGPNADQVSPAAMLIALFDMEEQQRRFKAKYPRQSSGQPQRTAAVVQKRRSLQLRITKLRLLQAAYMPIVPQLLARRHRLPHAEELAEDEMLFFPSQLRADNLFACTPGIVEIEERLREGQLHDALDKLRLHLHIKTRLITFKDRNVRNQVANTRARGRIDANEIKVKASASKYRRAREAKLALAGPGDWENKWRVLRDTDVRTMKGDIVEDSAVLAGAGIPSSAPSADSEGRRKTSWIWLSADVTDEGNPSGMNNALRVEFLKARARCHRFTEEICHIREEQRRTFVSLEKDALRWDTRVFAPHQSDASVREGLAAYSAEQANLRRCLVQTY